MSKSETYTADSIQELSDKTHYLKRPNLIWGAEWGNEKAPYSSQKGVALREITDNAVDEALAGYADKIRVVFYKDGAVEVFDNGRGLPVDVNKTTGKSGIVQTLGTLRAGRNFDSTSTVTSTGTNGLGAAGTNIFSSRFDVTVYRNGKQYSLSFKNGDPGFFSEPDNPNSEFTPLDNIAFVKAERDSRSTEEKKQFKTGTKIKFWLNNNSFPSKYPYSEQDLINRLRGTAYLVDNLTIHIVNHLVEVIDEKGNKVPEEFSFNFPGGTQEYVSNLQPKPALCDPVVFQGEGAYTSKNVPVVGEDGTVSHQDIERVVKYDIAFAWNEGYDFTVKSYVNTVETPLHGVHLTAFERAMSQKMSERLLSMRGLFTRKDPEPVVDDFEEGLTLVVSVGVNEPNYSGQSKEQLSGREVQRALTEALSADFEKWIKDAKNKGLLTLIGKKIASAAKNRQRAQDQKALNRQKNQISRMSLPSKLLDCSMAGTDEAELYIAEGDSAVTSLKAARDGKRHALLGIRGKIVNVYKASDAAVLKNAEIQDIITTLGAGSGKDFDIDKMRYGRVFIAVDADPDGNHIATLLYGVFWKLFRDVILEGRLYKLMTPLFVIEVKGRKYRKLYAQDEEERDEIIAELKKSREKYTVSRLKGLGEMPEDVLSETGLDPETRVVTQITVGDVERAVEVMELILDQNSDERKEWITERDVDEALLGD